MHYVCARVFFFFNDTATTEIYTLSLHDALPIWTSLAKEASWGMVIPRLYHASRPRSEEHTSELQSHLNLVCRLLLEKTKIKDKDRRHQRRARPSETQRRLRVR